MDNVQTRGPKDRYRINMNEDSEVHYWMHVLGVSRETLQAAVDEVGVMTTKVRAYLGQRVTSS